MNRRHFLALTLGIASVSLLAGCGGGGGGGGGGAAWVSRRYTVQLPAGVSLPTTELVVELGQDSAAVDATGAFTARVPGADVPSLGIVRDKTGRGVLLGFLPTDGSPLTAHSAAVALVYYALGGFSVPEQNRRALVNLLGAETSVATLGEVIARRMAANPYVLETDDTEITTALKSAYDTLLAGRGRRETAFGRAVEKTGRAVDPILLVQPGTVQSNLEVLQDTGVNVKAVNHSRRFCKVYAYRTGTPDPLPTALLQGSPIKLSSTNALGIVTTINNFTSGNTAYVPVSTAPIPLPLAPGSNKTLYDVVIIGASVNNDPRAFYSDPKYAAEKDKWLKDHDELNELTWWNNFILPIFLEVAGIAGTALATSAIEGTLAAIRAIEATAVKDLLFAARQGSLIVAADRFWKLAATDTLVGPQLRQAMMPLLDAAAAQLSVETLAARVTLFFKIAARAAIAAVLLLGAGDLAAVAKDVASAQPAERWSVTVFQPTLQLNPTRATIGKGGRVNLTATVPGATGQKIIYAWKQSAANAHLQGPNVGQPGNTGNEIETVNNGTVTLNTTPSTIGPVTVQVEAFLEKDGKRSSIGQAAAVITIDENKLVVAGQFKALGWLIPPPPGSTNPEADTGHGEVAVMIIPRVAKAKSYDIYAFGFNDTAYYGKELRKSLPGEPLSGYPDWDGVSRLVTDSKTASAVYVGLSGGSGNYGTAAKVAEGIAALNARFAGMEIEVTVTL